MGSRPDRSAPTPSPAGGWARQCPVSELEHAHVVRRRGAATLAPLLDKRRPTARTKRQAEARFLTLIRAAGLPPPEVNTVLHGYEVDFLWRAHDVVVEIDGYTYHSTRSAFERDHRKDVVMRRAGLSVARFTRDQVMDEPFGVIADVARSLMPPSPGPGQAARAGGAAAR